MSFSPTGFYPGSSSSNDHLLYVSSRKCVEAITDSLLLSFLTFVWMSKSRSATPTPSNTFSTNTSLESTTSRPQSYEHTPSLLPPRRHEQPSTSRSAPFHSLLHISPPSPAQLVHLPESQVDQQMAKHFHKESPQEHSGPEAQSSPSSDSQDDMADTEMDDKQNRPSETPVPIVPAKKKRTRTLTTPHQSAVLHALLAQSRFPTTAMREEVGRSIGLSARKVQIWFQNQRQKARRPRSQSDSSRKRLPQYGPFPSGPHTSAVGSFSFVPQGAGSRMFQPFHSSGMGTVPQDQSEQSGYHSADSISGPSDSPGKLLGPGMPGSDPQADLSYRGRPDIIPVHSAHDAPSLASNSYIKTEQRVLPSPSSSRTQLPAPSSRLRDREFSRTLPPLVFHPSQGRSSLPAPGPYGTYPSTSRSGITPHLKRSLSPDTTFALRPSETTPRSTLTLSPPYTLQPPPQWGDATIPPTLRPPEPFSWSSQSTSRSSTPPIHLARNLQACSMNEGETPQSETRPPPRSGRYDPVRATFIYTNPIEGSSVDIDDSSPNKDDKKT